MGSVDEFLGERTVEAGKARAEVGLQRVADGDRPDADRGGDAGRIRNGDLPGARDELERTEKAGGIVRRETLLGIGTIAAGTTKRLRHRELGD